MNIKETIKTKGRQLVLGASASLVSIASVSAYTMTGEISDIIPVIDDCVSLFPSILGIVVGIMPIVIAVAFMGFITGMFTVVLSKLRFT